ncbi:hypothetical protein JNB62_05260 [Microbacterium jejuense]|uniref:Uncharacterized protein n=1 Tax=Microbacterium jejuense TaxID=1263637 RepID=A0ABS7HMF2_9MICO|nr:hypothetical protein [Microbacterium jejuense]MBW9093083.1 hypothetical protein [Microbacterium jejuense]
MGTGDQSRAQQDDVWRRNRDSVEVVVEDVFEMDGECLVGWGEIDSPHENICTERYFVRAYTLVERPV